VLRAPGLFRLDAVVASDTLRVIVRNLSSARLEYHDEGYGRPTWDQGDARVIAALRPGHHQMTMTLGEPGDGVRVRVILTTLRLPSSDLVRITGQATIDRA
jgi:hypothetical protein